MCFFDVLAERNQTHLGWSNVGSNNRKNWRGDGMTIEEVEKQEKCSARIKLTRQHEEREIHRHVY
jgi:hypothetical protein